MTSRPGFRRTRLAGLLIIGLLVVVGVLAPAAPASAHATLSRTEPAAGTILDNAPVEVRLVFSEPVDIGLGKLAVVGPDGRNVARGKAARRGNGSEVVIPLRSGLQQGTYLVSYRVGSADGHPISGGFPFSIQVPSAQATQVPVDTGGAAVDPWVRVIQSTGRYVAYAGVALLAGSLLMLLALWPRRLPLAGPRRLAWWGWGLLFGGTLTTLLLQAPYTSGEPLTGVSWDGFLHTIDTEVGKALVVRLACLLAALSVMRRIVTGKVLGLADTMLAALLGTGILLTWPFAGHSAATPSRLLSIPADAVHVAAMALWLGGLVVLALHLLPSADERELGAILPVWSRWASYAVIALAFTGTVLALLELGSFGALVDTVYGQLVITKIIGLAVILVAASFARSWVRGRYLLPVAQALSATDAEPGPLKGDDDRSKDGEPDEAPSRAGEERSGEERSGGDPPREAGSADMRSGEAAAGSSSGRRGAVAVGGPPRLRQAVVMEVLLAALVLVVATALVQVTPGRNAGEAAVEQGLPYSDSATTSLFTLQIDIDPAARGNNSIHLTAFAPQGGPVKVLEWKGTAANPDKGINPVQIEFLPLSDNHVAGQVQLPVSGDWTFSFTARTSDVDQATVKRVVRIS